MFSSRNIIIALSLAVLVLGSFWFRAIWPEHKVGNNSKADVNVLAEKKKWKELIDTIGPEKAYANFKEEYKNQRYDRQHSIGHLFGTLLYDNVGQSGLTVCDNSFGFGCLHGFFSAALSAKGIDVVSELSNLCLEKFGIGGTGCQHGIGHGLLEFYSSNNLAKALEACKKTNQTVKIFGCTSGVFMEYNIPIPLDTKVLNLQSRQFDPEHPYLPCTGVPEEFHESCYFEIGQWWLSILKSDFSKIGLLCDKIKWQTNRQSCFLGVGNIVGPTNAYDVKKSIADCSQIYIQDGRLLCLAGVTWSIFGEPRVRSSFRSVCQDLAVADRDYCMKSADLVNKDGTTFKSF